MAQNARHTARSRVGPQRPPKFGGDENAVGRNSRLPSAANLARVAAKAGPQRPALGEVTTTTINNRRDATATFNFTFNKDNTIIKQSQSSTFTAPSGPQRAPVFPGRSATFNNIAAATSSTSTTVVHGQIQRAQRPINLKAQYVEQPKVEEDEDMDIEIDVHPERVGSMIKNEQLLELEEDELEDEPTPPRVFRQWPDVSSHKRDLYERQVDDIRENYDDVVDLYDTTMVSEYAEDIFDYMGQLELETMPNPDYMSKQTEITWEHRQQLIDWLLQVHLRYHMLPETLWIGINIVDRFLSRRIVSRAKLQLVGITAMFIAAKYEEIIAPSVDEFIEMAEGGYTKEEMLKGERIMLQTLDFKISGYCTPYSWVRRISKADDYDIQTRTLSKFLMEVTLFDHRFLRVPPSLIAAVGMFTAQKMLGGTWSEGFVYHSGFVEEQLMTGFQYIVERLIEFNFEKQYISKKYANKKFLKASNFAINWARRNYGSGEAYLINEDPGEENMIVVE